MISCQAHTLAAVNTQTKAHQITLVKTTIEAEKATWKTRNTSSTHQGPLEVEMTTNKNKTTNLKVKGENLDNQGKNL